MEYYNLVEKEDKEYLDFIELAIDSMDMKFTTLELVMKIFSPNPSSLINNFELLIKTVNSLIYEWSNLCHIEDEKIVHNYSRLWTSENIQFTEVNIMFIKLDMMERKGLTLNEVLKEEIFEWDSHRRSYCNDDNYESDSDYRYGIYGYEY